MKNVFPDLEEAMIHRTPEEREEFVNKAVAIAIAKQRPIVPPKGLSAEQEKIYIAFHDAFRRPVPVETDVAATRAPTRTANEGVIALPILSLPLK